MMINFAESGHPFIQATSVLERGELKRKGGGKKTIHYNGGEETFGFDWFFARLLLSISSVSTVADLRNELDPDYAESVICESLVIRLRVPTLTPHLRAQQAQGNLLQGYVKQFAERPEENMVETLQRCWFLKAD